MSREEYTKLSKRVSEEKKKEEENFKKQRQLTLKRKEEFYISLIDLTKVQRIRKQPMFKSFVCGFVAIIVLALCYLFLNNFKFSFELLMLLVVSGAMLVGMTEFIEDSWVLTDEEIRRALKMIYKDLDKYE
ncbi:hypothetical protein [Enterococcus sp. LJL51]|uniref:hypothetical protein n=1 Tax=Enterococcus sp. LJL51 TaxID=3416656 RepID=UPI003CF871A9